MSSTAVDMAKVTQMLDSGWVVQLDRAGFSGYVARARHQSEAVWSRARDRVREAIVASGQDYQTACMLTDADFCEPGVIDTEDFTPEQALTRLAYKVLGEIL